MTDRVYPDLSPKITNRDAHMYIPGRFLNRGTTRLLYCQLFYRRQYNSFINSDSGVKITHNFIPTGLPADDPVSLVGECYKLYAPSWSYYVFILNTYVIIVTGYIKVKK